MTYRRILFVALVMAVGLVSVGRPQSPGAKGKTAPSAGPGGSAGASDIELVERLLAARRDYEVVLGQLRTLYAASGDVERAQWAQEELLGYHRVIKQAFRLELDVPPPTLQAAYNIPEANELYKKAMSYKDKGWGTDALDNQHRAEILLQQLLTSYPQSDKIGDAAYQLGDIYEKKPYQQFRRAALYFERCFQWHPNTQHDARLRAARLYDKNLQERAKAIELYREITTHETDPKRLQEAQKRLSELSGGR